MAKNNDFSENWSEKRRFLQRIRCSIENNFLTKDSIFSKKKSVSFKKLKDF